MSFKNKFCIIMKRKSYKIMPIQTILFSLVIGYNTDNVIRR